ncbi:hypothetical protein LIER_41881 [Lithospermum erythrorhizon]|uniref:Uncharacterized protein n=1 Tax=Lithospermum erythrorhizon TaxID=34254 RepID=A0AAV3RFU5_LITER
MSICPEYGSPAQLPPVPASLSSGPHTVFSKYDLQGISLEEKASRESRRHHKAKQLWEPQSSPSPPKSNSPTCLGG